MHFVSATGINHRFYLSFNLEMDVMGQLLFWTGCHTERWPQCRLYYCHCTYVLGLGSPSSSKPCHDRRGVPHWKSTSCWRHQGENDCCELTSSFCFCWLKHLASGGKEWFNTREGDEEHRQCYSGHSFLIAFIWLDKYPHLPLPDLIHSSLPYDESLVFNFSMVWNNDSWNIQCFVKSYLWNKKIGQLSIG